MSQPRYTKVDQADYKRLRGYRWLASKGNNNYYALRHVPGGKGKKASINSMHREIIQVPRGMVVDHINHDGMDNRRANLRAATYSQNMCNVRKRSGAKHSKYKGINWRKRTRKWEVRVMFEKKRMHIGYFRDEIDAARAYDQAARKYHGEFASPNFP